MEKEDLRFCQQASKQYERWLEDAGGDPRSVAGKYPAAEWRIPYYRAQSRHTTIFENKKST